MKATHHLRWIASLPPAEVEAGARQKFILQQLWISEESEIQRGETCLVPVGFWLPVPQVGYGAPEEVRGVALRDMLLAGSTT